MSDDWLAIVEAELTIVLAYVRVSTEDQADGLGPEMQGDACHTLAAERWPGAEVHQYDDLGVSGTDIAADRPGLGNLIAAAEAARKEGHRVVVLVAKVDRLARDLIVQEQALATLWRVGVEVVSCAAGEAGYLVPDDPADPSRKLIRQILGAVAEWERAMIRSRLEGARRRKMAAGGFGGGVGPWGYRPDGRGGLEVDPVQIAARDLAFTLRAEGKIYREIAAELNRAGYRKPRSGTPWCQRTVQQAVVRTLATPEVAA